MNTTYLYAVVGAVALFWLLRKLGGGKRVPAALILEKIKGGAKVIDVRTQVEFSGGSYPKARNIPLDSLGSRLGELGPKEKPVVVFCASGSRSAQAARILRQAGFSDVINAGGLSGMPR